MATWRCPHCATPQPESSRCWVCRRSSTCCATCRHFRRSVAERIGFCGLDPRRAALRGDEIRPCWEWPLTAAHPASPTTTAEAPGATDTRTPVRERRVFVPLEIAAAGATPAADGGSDPASGERDRIALVAAAPVPAASGPTPWGLFPELD